tara:strand:- start:4433 stop:4723 length:291 start_codon:yes stop_codon:yes gene_type:complete
MTVSEVESFLNIEAKFTFAKTMANIPHSWICRKDFSDTKFLEVMNFIEQNGYSENFYGKDYTYYNIGGFKYWVMTDKQGFVDPTAIINRARILKAT